HFFTIDCGICQNDLGEVEPQLIELQAFPTLYGFQRELQNTLCEVYPFLNELKPEMTDEEYYSELSKLLIGGENPENVVLLEIHPHEQKTNIDLYITEKQLGMRRAGLAERKKNG